LAASNDRVLVIDDERRYRELLELSLRRHGYGVSLAADGLSGLNLFERDAPDLVVLDLRLPDLDGHEVCRRLRDYSEVPIIILSARTEGAEKLRALNQGADDYVTKPFWPDELLARIGAILRRTRMGSNATAPAPFSSAGLTIDFTTRRITLDGREVELSPTEYKVLYHLAVNAGRTLVHEELLRRVWGDESVHQPTILHNAIRRLRASLGEDVQAPRHVLTRRGVGYLLRAVNLVWISLVDAGGDAVLLWI
jgi:two-component system KDP operon response regulator KdpE